METLIYIFKCWEVSEFVMNYLSFVVPFQPSTFSFRNFRRSTSSERPWQKEAMESTIAIVSEVSAAFFEG